MEPRAIDEATRIRPVGDGDWNAVTRIFNRYVEGSFAAYPEEPVDASFFRGRCEANPTYPFVVADLDRSVVGFAFLAPIHPAATMRRTATVTYFLDPDHTGAGIGSSLLEHLLVRGGEFGVVNFLAHVSSRNEGSLRFHVRHGFRECGRFVGVGEKHGQVFDMVWLQRTVP